MTRPPLPLTMLLSLHTKRRELITALCSAVRVASLPHPHSARRMTKPAMNLARRPFLHLAATGAALPAASRIARAQAYPSRPITLIEPFSAGGPLDTIGRIL